MLRVGDIAPDFSLKATWAEKGPSVPGDEAPRKDHQIVTLSEYLGKKNVVLLFYPLDWSPVCSAEHKKCTLMFPRVPSEKIQVLGISVDSIWSHNAFSLNYGIPYPLLSDFQPRGAVAERYGVYLPDLGIASRTAFVIDRKGVVRDVIHANVPDEREIEAILQKANLD